MTCCPTCKQPLPEALPFAVDEANGAVTSAKGVAKISPYMMRFLTVMAKRHPGYVTKNQFMDILFGDEADPPEDHIVNVQISKLRRRLEPIGITVEHATHRYGYRLNMEGLK